MLDKKIFFNKYRKIIEPILYVISFFNIHSTRGCSIKGRSHALFSKFKISVTGKNNVIIIGDMCQIRNTSISIFGDNNIIKFGDLCNIEGASICIEDDSNSVQLGKHCYIYNNTEISAIEGTKVTFGEDCLLSSDIVVRSGDSHSIFDMKTKQRINSSQDIILGNHVWVGKRAMILKGVNIGSNCIIAAGAIVTSSVETISNVILGGCPAQIIKKDIDWGHIR